jgi:hypothetical protein
MKPIAKEMNIPHKSKRTIPAIILRTSACFSWIENGSIVNSGVGLVLFDEAIWTILQTRLCEIATWGDLREECPNMKRSLFGAC